MIQMAIITDITKDNISDILSYLDIDDIANFTWVFPQYKILLNEKFWSDKGESEGLLEIADKINTLYEYLEYRNLSTKIINRPTRILFPPNGTTQKSKKEMLRSIMRSQLISTMGPAIVGLIPKHFESYLCMIRFHDN